MAELALRTAPTPMVGRSSFVDVAGSRLHLLEYGERGRPQVVVVPGITSPAVTWEFVALDLARDFHVFTLDVRGRGLSDRGSAHSAEAYARDLAALLDELELDRPLVLGHSAGARIAAAYGAAYPDARGPLVLADPPLSGPGRPPYPMPLETYLDPIRWARSGAGTGDLRTFFPTLSDDELALRAAWLPTCDEEVVAETYRGFNEDDFFAWWRELHAPLLFLWGGESPVVTADAVADVAAANPAASVVCLPDAGHMLPWDDLDRFLAAIRGFDG